MEHKKPVLRGVSAPPCIWVQSGVLNYRLCDRAYDCESCELFHALRGRVPGAGRPSDEPLATEMSLPAKDEALESQVNDYMSHLLAGCHLYPDRYCAEHFWLTEVRGGEVLLGLHEHLLRILNPISDIVAPRAGIRLEQGVPCGWITRGRMAFTLFMPVSGEIADVNTGSLDALRDTPRLAQEDWLLRITACPPLENVEGLRRGEETLLWYLGKIQALKQFLREAIHPDLERDLVPMAADGGIPSDDLEQVLGTASFERLVEQVL